jgi:glycosyltransferase involved in cell wall biosynthesis
VNIPTILGILQKPGIRNPTMPYHIALSRPFDFATINREKDLGQRPNHTMWELSQAIDATLHAPDPAAITPFDRLAARLASHPQHWALARQLTAQLTEQDLVFCTGEDIGLPIAILRKFQQKPFKMVMSVMAPDRLRFRTVSQFFNIKSQVALFIADTHFKVDGLVNPLKLAPEQVYLNSVQTDVNFFKPGEMTLKNRPLVASAGLERRDYQTLAIATQDMNVDVKICAVSPNGSSKTKVAFPEVMPDNMTSRHYDWQEFVQLYRDADVVVVSLLQNYYSAGLTTLVEALACRRPVVMTRTPGLGEKLIDLGVAIGVEPGDAAGMRQAIEAVLNHPEMAAAMAQKGYELVHDRYTSEQYVNNFATEFRKVMEQEVDLVVECGAIV